MHAPAQLGMHLVVNMIIQQAVATSTQTTMHFMPKACDNQLEKLCMADAGAEVATTVQPIDSNPELTSALLAQQLPPLPNSVATVTHPQKTPSKNG